jgi:hypothetical protein
MNKYAPRYRYLAAQQGREVRLSFRELERLLGDQRTGPRPHAQAWMAAGWRVDAVNLGAESVRFRRG